MRDSRILLTLRVSSLYQQVCTKPNDTAEGIPEFWNDILLFWPLPCKSCVSFTLANPFDPWISAARHGHAQAGVVLPFISAFLFGLVASVDLDPSRDAHERSAQDVGNVLCLCVGAAVHGFQFLYYCHGLLRPWRVSR